MCLKETWNWSHCNKDLVNKCWSGKNVLDFLSFLVKSHSDPPWSNSKAFPIEKLYHINFATSLSWGLFWPTFVLLLTRLLVSPLSSPERSVINFPPEAHLSFCVDSGPEVSSSYSNSAMSETVVPDTMMSPAVGSLYGEKTGGPVVDFSYVGIDAILEQMRRKAMKQGFELNIMVVGKFYLFVLEYSFLTFFFLKLMHVHEGCMLIMTFSFFSWS